VRSLSLLPLVKLLADSSLGVYVRRSVRAVPVVADFHLLAWVVLIGVVLVVNLSACGGLLKTPTPTEVARALWPYFWVSLAVAIATGLTIMSSNAISYYYNPVFRTKMTLLTLAVILTACVHRRLRLLAGAAVPRPWRIAAGINLGLWFGTLIAGRVVGLF
jgi:hypothetical protein